MLTIENHPTTSAPMYKTTNVGRSLTIRSKVLLDRRAQSWYEARRLTADWCVKPDASLMACKVRHAPLFKSPHFFVLIVARRALLPALSGTDTDPPPHR